MNINRTQTQPTGDEKRVDYMEIFIPGWNFNSVYQDEKNCSYMNNLNQDWNYFNPGWNLIASSK